MHVVGICGTPRANGNSDILLQHALRPFAERGWEVSHLRVRDLDVHPCLGCERCRESGVCAIADDMQAVYELWRRCDAFVVASPVYWRNMTAQLIAVLHRHYAVRAERPLAGKPGGAIAVGRGTGGGQAIVVMSIYNWMLSAGMICVPGELNGVTAVASEPGDVLGQEKRLRQARILGENVLAVATKLRG